jgi:hypothetical protein
MVPNVTSPVVEVPNHAYSTKFMYLSIYPPLTDLPNTMYYLSRGMLQCCHKWLHLCVININFAKSVWKQAQIAYRQVGLADNLLTTVNQESTLVLDRRIFAMLLEATLARTT